MRGEISINNLRCPIYYDENEVTPNICYEHIFIEYDNNGNTISYSKWVPCSQEQGIFYPAHYEMVKVKK